MKYVEADCRVIKPYMEWLYRSVCDLTLDQFALWWRELSDEDRKVEWDKCTLHPDFD